MPEMRPVMYTWDGETESMIPVDRFRALANRQFVDGEVYALHIVERVAGAAHRGTMAEFASGWKRLPLDWTVEYPTMDHLRKRVCIVAGWCNHRHIVLKHEEDARQMVMELSAKDEYALLLQNGCVVQEFTAKSMSPRHFHDRAVYQRLKQHLIYALDLMLQVAHGEIERAQAQSLMPRVQLLELQKYIDNPLPAPKKVAKS